jgi:hypothetical protein
LAKLGCASERILFDGDGLVSWKTREPELAAP